MAAFVHVLSENVLSIRGPCSVLWEQKQIGRHLGLQKAESLAGERACWGNTSELERRRGTRGGGSAGTASLSGPGPERRQGTPFQGTSTDRDPLHVDTPIRRSNGQSSSVRRGKGELEGGARKGRAV